MIDYTHDVGSHTARLVYGLDAVDGLSLLPDSSVNCVITSPPYWGLRTYLADDDLLKPSEIGDEVDPYKFINILVGVFKHVRRVLRDDGVLWINIGDAYAGSCKGLAYDKIVDPKRKKMLGKSLNKRPVPEGLKHKDLIGIPWRLAFALQADGWYLRSDVIWHKTNPIPQGVFDRPINSHEYLFMLTKSRHYWYDAEAVKEPSADGKGRLRRSVWTTPSVPSETSHTAPMPPKVVEPCVLSSCPSGGVVLDPFCGTGTVGMVTTQKGRSFVGIDLDITQYDEALRKIMSQPASILDVFGDDR